MKKAQKTRLLRVGSLAMAAALLTACGSGTSSSSSAAASESASEAESVSSEAETAALPVAQRDDVRQKPPLRMALHGRTTPALLIWNGSSALRGMATLGAKASFLKTSPKRRA